MLPLYGNCKISELNSLIAPKDLIALPFSSRLFYKFNSLAVGRGRPFRDVSIFNVENVFSSDTTSSTL